MKKLALIAALAMTFASQAFAQSYDHDFGSGNIANPVQADGTNGQFGVGTGALDSGSYDTSPNASAPRRVRRAQSPAQTKNPRPARAGDLAGDLAGDFRMD